jgi:hypothetical protein
MKRAAAGILVAALMAAGCAARYQVNANSNTASNIGAAPPGTTITSGSTGLHVQSGSGSVAAAIIAISLMAGAIEHSREPRPFPSPAALFPEQPARAPELAPDRRVSEQDCTKPLDLSAGNLRCK